MCLLAGISLTFTPHYPHIVFAVLIESYCSLVLYNGQLKGQMGMGEELKFQNLVVTSDQSSSLGLQPRPQHSYLMIVQLELEQISNSSTTFIPGKQNVRKSLFHMRKATGSNVIGSSYFIV